MLASCLLVQVYQLLCLMSHIQSLEGLEDFCSMVQHFALFMFCQLHKKLICSHFLHKCLIFAGMAKGVMVVKAWGFSDNAQRTKTLNRRRKSSI
jgi:hypothetical protein